MKEGWRILMFGLFSKGRVRQCQLYLEESHVETHVCDSENSIKRDAGCFGTNIPSLDKHTHTTKGWWPAVTLVPWCLLCHGGWGQENDSPDTNWHATGKASLTNTSSPPSVPLSLCFPSELSQETTTSCCVPKRTIYFQRQGGKQITPHPYYLYVVLTVRYSMVLVFAVKNVLKYVSLLYLLTYMNKIYLICYIARPLNMDTHVI